VKTAFPLIQKYDTPPKSMTKTTDKRGRGRPRNEALDLLQAELAVSRRRASSVLREIKSTPASGSENSAPALSPLAAARLEKLTREISLLEIKIQTARAEQDVLDRNLVTLDEAKELVERAVGPVVQQLRILPKSLTPRLVNGTSRFIETTLTDEANRILALARENLTRFNSNLKGRCRA
jgi:hypothetical protein